MALAHRDPPFFHPFLVDAQLSGECPRVRKSGYGHARPKSDRPVLISLFLGGEEYRKAFIDQFHKLPLIFSRNRLFLITPLFNRFILDSQCQGDRFDRMMGIYLLQGRFQANSEHWRLLWVRASVVVLNNSSFLTTSQVDIRSCISGTTSSLQQIQRSI